MKKLKLLTTLLAIAAVSASLYTLPISAATSQVNLSLSNVTTSSSTNVLGSTFQITNTGSESINLSDLKIRYYYTEDGTQDQNFNCYYSAVSNPSKDITGKIKGTFGKMDNPTATADTYFEISFSSDSGTIAAGGTVSVQAAVNKSDWSNYDQTNDYSFNNSKDIVVYSGSNVIWGIAPSGTSAVTDSKLDKTEVKLDKDSISDVTVNMELNGNEFEGISGLKEGTDYIVKDTAVTIAKSYLEALPVGDTDLTFNFNQGNPQKLKISINQNTELSASIGQVEGSAGDTITLPVTLKGTPSAGIADFGYRIKYDPNLVEIVSVEPGDAITDKENNFVSKVITDKNLISVLFIDSALNDTETIKDGGELTKITLKIKDTAAKGTASIDFNDDDHSFYDVNGNELKVDFASGRLTVK